jgi:hypothetical protein
VSDHGEEGQPTTNLRKAGLNMDCSSTSKVIGQIESRRHATLQEFYGGTKGDIVIKLKQRRSIRQLS